MVLLAAGAEGAVRGWADALPSVVVRCTGVVLLLPSRGTSAVLGTTLVVALTFLGLEVTPSLTLSLLTAGR